jgi:hypothetical protein
MMRGSYGGAALSTTVHAFPVIRECLLTEEHLSPPAAKRGDGN